MAVTPYRHLLLGVLSIVVGVLVAGCAGSASGPITEGEDGGGVGAPFSAASAAPGQGSPILGDDTGSNAALQDDLRIVYTGSLQMVVGDLPTALASAKAAVGAVGGYIGASEESNRRGRPSATITYRIPAQRWDDAIASLRGLATTVVAEQTQATEVGGQIVDLEARLRNLRASEASLRTIAQGTASVKDLLDVEAQLTNVRGQIEQLDAQRAHLEDQVAYGTLVATFGLERGEVEEAAKEWDPTRDVDRATATLIGIGQGLVSGAIWFAIVWLPFIIVLVVLILVARWLFRRFAPHGAPSGPVAGWGDGSDHTA